MRINLRVPYEERNTAKLLGAKWDAAKRVWYVIDPPDLSPFSRWLPAEVHAFIVKSTSSSEPAAKRREPWQGRAGAQEMRNEGPTNYTPNWQPQDIPPGDPPW